MILHHVETVVPSPFTPVHLIPWGCVHADDPGFRRDLFRQCLEEVRSTPYCATVGLGDYRNFLRTHARKWLHQYPHDEDSFRELDSMVRREAVEFVQQYLVPVRERLWGLSEGNHLHEFQDRTTDTQFMCQQLQVPYLEKLAFLRWQIRCQSRVLATLKVLIHHGDWSAGASRVGGDLNALENKALGFDADIILAAHTHRKIAYLSPILTIPQSGELRTISRPRVYIKAGCFVGAYDKCAPTNYAQRKLMHPTELGYVRLTVKFTKQHWPARYAHLRRAGQERRRASAASARYGHQFEVRI